MNRTMQAKHKKARQMACQAYKEQALAESVEDIVCGRIKVHAQVPDMRIRIPEEKSERIKVKAGHGYKKVSSVLLDFYRKEFERV